MNLSADAEQGRGGGFSEQIRASDRVADELLVLIQRDRISPGARLPPETHLAVEFGVSRTVIREAIARLRARGVLRSEQGRGTFVLTVPARAASAPWPAVGADVTGMLEFRAALESESAALAARRRSPRHLRQLTAILDRTDLSSPADAVEADWQFHREVARATGNEYFVAALESLGPGSIMVPPARLAEDDATLVRAWEEHRAVIRAISRGDAIAAGAAMRAHLQNSMDRTNRAP